MSQDQKFQQRWEFRRGDDDVDSSSNETKSSSGGEPLLKKHKLVPNLILPENDESLSPQQESELHPDMGIPFEFGKADKVHIGPSNEKCAVKDKMKMGSMGKRNRKKKKKILQEPISMDDFEIFMKSVIEDLKVARENMFTCMREEMKKLVATELAPKPTRKKGRCVQKTVRGKNQNNVESGVKAKNCNGGSLERSVKSDRTTDSNVRHEVVEKQVNHDQAIGATKPKENENVEKLRLPLRKPTYSSSLSDQVVSSPYLSLPTVLCEPQAENHKLDSSCNYIQPRAAENKASMNLESAKLLIDASTRRGYFSGNQQAEQFGCFSQPGSQTLSYFDQQSTQTSNTGSGFPVPLHQGLGNGFQIPSQAMENSSQANNVLGLRMNGGAIRFTGGSRALSERFVSSNIHGQLNYKTNGLMAFGNQDMKGGNLYPN